MKIMPDAYVRKHELAKALRETKGHPLYSFTEENEKFSKEISDIYKNVIKEAELLLV